ncbi:MAG TPA: thioesterase family protein [Casimicrobiaceae bacterium]
MTTHHAPRIPVFTSRQPIRWGDMDSLGHVNNTVYFRYMEQARIEWLFSLAAEGGYAATGTGPVIVNASCTFELPLVYPGEVEVRMSLGGLGRSSVGSFYELFKDGRRYAEGAAKIVWIELATGRPVPLPESIAAPLRAAAGT